jgi:hypothetical protein
MDAGFSKSGPAVEIKGKINHKIFCSNDLFSIIAPILNFFWDRM